MDGDLRRLIAKVSGAAVALVVFALGLKLGCGRHDDPAADTRRDLLVTGCDRAGFEPTSPRFRPCLDAAKARCKMGDDEDVLKCRRLDPDAPTAPTLCSAIVKCAKGAGDGLK